MHFFLCNMRSIAKTVGYFVFVFAYLCSDSGKPGGCRYLQFSEKRLSENLGAAQKNVNFLKSVRDTVEPR